MKFSLFATFLVRRQTSPNLPMAPPTFSSSSKGGGNSGVGRVFLDDSNDLHLKRRKSLRRHPVWAYFGDVSKKVCFPTYDFVAFHNFSMFKAR
jgi:hypothetical protein